MLANTNLNPTMEKSLIKSARIRFKSGGGELLEITHENGEILPYGFDSAYDGGRVWSIVTAPPHVPSSPFSLLANGAPLPQWLINKIEIIEGTNKIKFTDFIKNTPDPEPEVLFCKPPVQYFKEEAVTDEDVERVKNVLQENANIPPYAYNNIKKEDLGSLFKDCTPSWAKDSSKTTDPPRDTQDRQRHAEEEIAKVITDNILITAVAIAFWTGAVVSGVITYFVCK